MKQHFLIPHPYKMYGWIIFIASAIMGMATMYFGFEIPGFEFFTLENGSFLDFRDSNLTNELALIGVVVGLLMISFAKEKNEDEYISYLRLRAWQWSVLMSYLFLIAITLLVYGSTFFTVIFYNTFSILLLFIIKFQLSLYYMNREEKCHEE